ncbi:MAG: hypothetical protein JWO60_2068, partial [Frankiales bacterium]|nr:hypothetical protein [Frankiales bacterium]
PAAAAPGDPVLAGRGNDAAGAVTSLSGGTADAPALSVTNPAVRGADGGTYGAPALRIAPGPGVDLGLDVDTSDAGDLASGGDQLWYAHTRGTQGTVVGAVYTSAFANHLAFVTPRRVLDTRRALAGSEAGAPNDGRSRVVAGRFDAAGRLSAGSSLVLDLSELLVGDQAGVLGNVTAIGPQGSGFLAAYPTPTDSLDTTGAGRPAVSTVNYTRGAAAVGNFTVVGFEAGNRLSIYTTTTTHVTFDVVAFSVFDPFSTADGTAARVASGWRGRRPGGQGA